LTSSWGWAAASPSTVPQEGVSALTVSPQGLEIGARDQRLGLGGGVAHLPDEE
jgi:hypothetical protein